MRRDIKRIFHERGRKGHGYRYRDVRVSNKTIDWDTFAQSQGIRKPYLGHWGLSDSTQSTGALEGYLHKRKGDLWNSVWSEICKNADSRTYSGKEIRRWFRNRVAIKVHEVDEKLYYATRWSGWREVEEFYVDLDGRLQWAGEPEWRKARARRIKKEKVTDGIRYQKVGDILEYVPSRFRVAIDPIRAHSRKIFEFEKKEAFLYLGIWYWVEFTYLPKFYPWEKVELAEFEDIVTGKKVTQGAWRSGKKQMSSQELEKYGLSNIDWVEEPKIKELEPENDVFRMLNL